MGKQRPWLAGLMAVFGVVVLYRTRLRPWMYTWGASDDEITALLPGDELVAAHTPRTTRALTIDAPISAIWPWLAQIGEDRGGVYSYSVLERAVGAHIEKANSLHPEWEGGRARRVRCAPFRHGAKDDARYPRSRPTDASRPGQRVRWSQVSRRS